MVAVKNLQEMAGRARHRHWLGSQSANSGTLLRRASLVSSFYHPTPHRAFRSYVSLLDEPIKEVNCFQDTRRSYFKFRVRRGKSRSVTVRTRAAQPTIHGQRILWDIQRRSAAVLLPCRQVWRTEQIFFLRVSALAACIRIRTVNLQVTSRVQSNTNAQPFRELCWLDTPYNEYKTGQRGGENDLTAKECEDNDQGQIWMQNIPRTLVRNFRRSFAVRRPE